MPFERVGDLVVTEVTQEEAVVLCDLAQAVVEVLGEDVRLDPARARLLPDVSVADPDLASEFRKATETELAMAKIDGLDAFCSAMRRESIELPLSDAGEVLRALADIRLLLAARLDVTSQDDADLVMAIAEGRSAADPERRQLAVVYLALAWWQETLVAALAFGLE